MNVAQHHYGLVTEWLESFSDRHFAEQETRYADVIALGEKVPAWRDEDKANGMPWADEADGGAIACGTVAGRASPEPESGLGHSATINYRKGEEA